MALTPLTGTATTTVKVGDFNKMIEALNAELAALGERQAAIEAQLGGQLTILESAVAGTSDQLTGFGARLDGLETLGARITALEAEPDPVIPPDLTERVEALENMVQRAPAENPTPAGPVDRVGRPKNLPADRMVLVYDRATIYYDNMELYADRIGENKWRLYAQLNFMVVAPVLWTYDEIIEGTAEEVYQHATRRLEELHRLKPIHDAVHERVVAMSEGQP